MIADRTVHSHLRAARVCVALSAPSKEHLIEVLVERAATAPEVDDADKLLQDVLAREARMSTGVGHGLALPHARTDAVHGTVMAIATLAEPVEFDSIDDLPVRIAVLLAGPEKDSGAHVRLLSRISRIMAVPETREALISAISSDEVVRALSEAEAQLV